MASIPYDPSRQALFNPGAADNFFQLDPAQTQSDVALCIEMSRLSYVKEEARLDKYLQRAQFQKKLALGYGTKGTQVFIASKPAENVTVVAFRGTEPDDPSDLFTDARFVRTAWANASGAPFGEVHQGFADALLKDDVARQVKNSLDSIAPPNRFLVTGHSLGASLATLMASWIPSSHLYTFGSPLVGDAAFAQAMRNIANTRFVDCCDLVTRLPPESFGYIHVGTFRYIDRNGHLLDAPTEDVVKADRRAGAAWYLIHHALMHGTVSSRDLADHAPINYVSGVMGLRVQV
jgi:hypothetical protein